MIHTIAASKRLFRFCTSKILSFLRKEGTKKGAEVVMADVEEELQNGHSQHFPNSKVLLMKELLMGFLPSR